MNITLIGGAGFIGTNLAISLCKNKNNKVTVIDTHKEYFNNLVTKHLENLFLIETSPWEKVDYYKYLKHQDIVYYLISTTNPSKSNNNISYEIATDIQIATKAFDSCIKAEVKKIVFLSSGGTVYGEKGKYPIAEEMTTDPITSYGVQKLAIEKILQLYHYKYGIDYRIIRLSNPYGPYQRPNGLLGAITTFTYQALVGNEIKVYGDGSVIRDFIYIDDAINGVRKIAEEECKGHLYNLGSGHGTSINEVLGIISSELGASLKIVYLSGRKVDVPINYLDISKFERDFGQLKLITLQEGIKKTILFMKNYYSI